MAAPPAGRRRRGRCAPVRQGRPRRRSPSRARRPDASMTAGGPEPGLPAATSTPLRITSTWSASATSRRSWVDVTIVCPPSREPFEQRDQDLGALRVEAGRRLVGHDQRRVAGDGHREGQPLLLARRPARVGRASKTSPSPATSTSASTDTRGLRLAHPPRQTHLGAHVEVVEEVLGGHLEHVADAAPDEAAARPAAEVPGAVAADQHVADRRPLQPAEQPEQGGLAGAGRPDDDGQGPPRHGEAHLAQGVHRAARRRVDLHDLPALGGERVTRRHGASSASIGGRPRAR